MQKNAVGSREECGNGVWCGDLFKKLQILSLVSPYLLNLLLFAVPDQNILSTHIENHNIDIR